MTERYTGWNMTPNNSAQYNQISGWTPINTPKMQVSMLNRFEISYEDSDKISKSTTPEQTNTSTLKRKSHDSQALEDSKGKVRKLNQNRNCQIGNLSRHEDILKKNTSEVLHTNVDSENGFDIFELEELEALDDVNFKNYQKPESVSAHQESNTISNKVQTPESSKLSQTSPTSTVENVTLMKYHPHTPQSQRPIPKLLLRPITGNTTLQTCFRIGEAINTGARALREAKDVAVELFARVKSSFRDKNTQHFDLFDLYHDRPPHLTAYYNYWKSLPQSETLSKVFLMRSEAKKICRCLGRMVRNEDGKLVLYVIDIWESDWERVEFDRKLHGRT